MFRYCCSLLLLCVASIAVSSAHAAEWVKLRSKHFELYTSQPRQVGRQAIERLESIHDAFAAVGHASNEPGEPLQVILFSGYNEYGFYSPGHFVKAFFTNISSQQFQRSVMVVSDFNKDVDQMMIHEFAHYCSRELGGFLPLWLEEGLASYHETLEIASDRLTLGKPVERHVKLLKSKRFVPIPFGDLFTMRHEDRKQHTWDEASALYAEGWAVVHTLATDPKFPPKFSEFLAKMRSGMPVHEALDDVYGTTIAQLRGDVDEHIDKLGKNGTTAPVKPATESYAIEDLPIQPWESRLLLTNLLVYLGKPTEAEHDFDALLKEFPAVPEISESLGDFKYLRNEKVVALRHYRSAIEKGSQNPLTHLRVAEADGAAAGSITKAFELLDASLRQHPQNQEMRLQAMDWAFGQRQYEKAAEWAGRFAESGDLRDFEFNYTAGYAHFRADDFAEAEQWIKRAQAVTDDATEKQRAANLLERIDLGLQRRRAAARIADNIGMENGFAEPGATAPHQARRPGPTTQDLSPDQVDLTRDIDRSNDTAIDAERLDQTLNVFTKNRGGKVVEGTMQELRCLGTGAQLVILSSGKRLAFEIDDPSNILITRGGEHVANHDFRCGRQPAEKVHVGYAPAEKDGRIGFLRILQFD